MPNTHFPWARSEDFSPFREHRLIYDVEAGATKGEVEAKAKEGGDAVPAPERFGKMADARRKSADANVKGASDGVRTATERAGKELNNFFDDLNRPVTLSEEAQKSAGNILRSYDAQTNYSREETTARLQVLGFQFTTDGPDNEFDRAVQNAKAEPPGTVVPPLRAGSTISKISGAFGLFNTMLQRHVRDRGGSQSERGKFVTGVEDFNRSNRNTASLMINQRAAAGTTPASEDLSVTLLQTGAVTTKEMQERRQNFTKQLRTGNLVNETDMKARENDSNIFVIKDITPAKFRQVQNAINAIRDSRDAAPPPVSTGPSGSSSGSPSGSPTGAPAPDTPEGKAKAEAAKTRKESVDNARLVVIPLIQGRLGLLNSSADQLALRKSVEAKIAELNSACGLPEGDAGTKQIRERTEELQKLGQDIDKVTEQGKKDTETVRKNATTELERGQKVQTDNAAVLPENMRKRLTGNIEQLAAVTDPPQETAVIQKNLKVLTVTLARVDELLPSYDQSAKAIAAARQRALAPGLSADLIKAGEANIKALEDARNSDTATPKAIAEAIGVLVGTEKKFEAEQKEKEVQDKVRKRVSDAKTRVETLRQALEKESGGLPDGGGWNGKLVTESLTNVETILKSVRLSPAQISTLQDESQYLEARVKILEGIASTRATDRKQTEADNKAKETREANAKTRRTQGVTTILDRTKYGGTLTGDIRPRTANNEFDIDIHGGGAGGSQTVDVLVLKWNESSKSWNWGLTAYYNNEPPRTWEVDNRPYNRWNASGENPLQTGNIRNNTGYAQTIAILGHLQALQESHPVT